MIARGTLIFVCVLTLSGNVFAQNRSFRFNGTCSSAMSSNEFTLPLRTAFQNLLSITNMTRFLTEDQKDRGLAVIVQGTLALRSVSQLLTLRTLRPLISSSFVGDAESIMSEVLEEEVVRLAAIAESLDSSLLLFNNEGYREEIRELRRSIQAMLSSLSSCKL